MEVIDLSSGDEEPPAKKRFSVTSANALPKLEPTPHIDEKSEACNVITNNKRGISESTRPSPLKRNKLTANDKFVGMVNAESVSAVPLTQQKSENGSFTPWISRNRPKSIPLEPEPCSVKPQTDKMNNNKLLKDDCDIQTTKISTSGYSSEKTSEAQQTSPLKQTVKPSLVIKSKIQISDAPEDALAVVAESFQSFLDACRSRDPSEDMKIILSKLKKRFDKLEPSYAKSETFKHLLRCKIKLISKDSFRTSLFHNIAEVMDEMKARQMRKNSQMTGQDRLCVDKPETSKDLKSVKQSLDNSEEIEEVMTADDIRDMKRLKTLEKAMRRCERLIHKCETAEVDFDDESDSLYILAEKYKCRMVMLYNKYCEITGERPDAARSYLRPKDISLTPFPSLNNAITSFINSRITQANNLAARGRKSDQLVRLTDAVVFPDYQDILNCVKKCNDDQNLQLTKLKQQDIAKNTFSQLGENLQRYRQLDYYDTFSLYLEKEDVDPAAKDDTLAEKLRKNDEIGRAKLNAVFEEFVAKQASAKSDEQGSDLTEAEAGDKSADASASESQHSDASSNDLLNIELDSAGDSDDSDKTVKSISVRNESKTHTAKSNEEPENIEDSAALEIIEEEHANMDFNKPRTDDIREGDEKKTEEDKSKELGDDECTEVEDDEITRIEDDDSIEIEENASTKVKDGAIDSSTLSLSNVVPSIQITRVRDQCSKISVAPDNTIETNSLQARVPKATSTSTTGKVALVRSSETRDDVKSMDDLPVASATNSTVIDAPAVTTNLELIEEKEDTTPVLRVRSFAKPPGFWSDSLSPPKTRMPDSATTEVTSTTSSELKEVEKASLGSKITSSVSHKQKSPEKVGRFHAANSSNLEADNLDTLQKASFNLNGMKRNNTVIDTAILPINASSNPLRLIRPKNISIIPGRQFKITRPAPTSECNKTMVQLVNRASDAVTSRSIIPASVEKPLKTSANQGYPSRPTSTVRSNVQVTSSTTSGLPCNVTLPRKVLLHKQNVHPKPQDSTPIYLVE